MKYNFIPKYGRGGNTYSSFVVYQPTEYNTPRQQAPTEKSSSKDDGLIDKDIMKMLQSMDALPNEMEAIINSARDFYFNATDDIISGQSTSDISIRYLNLLNNVKIAKFNKEEYDNAFEIVKANGGLGEFALTDQGQLICYDSKNNFKFLTPEQLRENTDYTPLTNTQLLQFRARDSSLAFNKNILNVVQNGIGVESVQKIINDVVNKIGETTSVEKGIVNGLEKRAIEGLQQYKSAILEAQDKKGFEGTVDELYKYEIISKSSAEQAQAAINYVYSMLPQKAKAFLKIKSDLTTEGAIKLMQSLIASQLSPSTTISLTPEGTIDKDGSKSKSTKTSKETEPKYDLKATQAVIKTMGYAGDPGVFTIDYGDGVAMTVAGTKYYSVTNKKNEEIENTTIMSLLNQSGLKAVIKNANAITYGDQPITLEDLRNIVYDDTGIYRIIAPIKSDGSIDFSRIDKYQEAEKEIKTSTVELTKEEIKEIYNKYGVYDIFKEDGSIDETKVGAFFAIPGYSTENLIGKQTSKYIYQYSNDQVTDAMERTINSGLKNAANGGDSPTVDRKDYLLEFWGYDKFYKGVVYIPVTNNELNMALADGQTIRRTEAMELEKKYQDYERKAPFDKEYKAAEDNDVPII